MIQRNATEHKNRAGHTVLRPLSRKPTWILWRHKREFRFFFKMWKGSLECIIYTTSRGSMDAWSRGTLCCSHPSLPGVAWGCIPPVHAEQILCDLCRAPCTLRSSPEQAALRCSQHPPTCGRHGFGFGAYH